ncbi:hypothetical protein JCM4914_64050 [Streptomyces platensis subsp. malvinus]
MRTKLTDAELSVALYAATGIVTRPKLMANFAVGRMGAAFIGAFGSMLSGPGKPYIPGHTGHGPIGSGGSPGARPQTLGGPRIRSGHVTSCRRSPAQSAQMMKMSMATSVRAQNG